MQDKTSTAMQVYFFHTFTNGVERHPTEGLAFASDAEAWHEGSTSSGEILREMDGKMRPGLDWRMDVLNAKGDVLFQFTFKAEDLSAPSSTAKILPFSVPD